jgi:hypothetical protein
VVAGSCEGRLLLGKFGAEVVEGFGEGGLVDVSDGGVLVVGSCGVGRSLGKSESTGVTFGAEVRVGIGLGGGVASALKPLPFDLVEVLRRKRLTVPRPPSGVARTESIVTTRPKTAALNREAGTVFMIHSMTLTTSGSEFSSC